MFQLEENGVSGNLRNILQDFLENWKQRVLLNGQVSSWAGITAGVPQGSILRQLFFLIYINDFSKDLSSRAKLLVHDTSLFFVINDTNTWRPELNDDLSAIKNWAF